MPERKNKGRLAGFNLGRIYWINLSLPTMESNEKVKILKIFKEFAPYAILVIGFTIAKVYLYKSRAKNIARARLVFITLTSLLIGFLSGMICYGLDAAPWFAYLVVSGSTLSSESIIEVYLAHSKIAFLRVWDVAVEAIFSWIEKKKKK